MGNRYIYNRHIAPITVNARDGKGAVLFTKKFQPERVDGTTGRIVSTGYTTLTDEEYDLLATSSRTFVHYKDKLGLLAECDDLPPEAKTPQEALVSARRKEREAQDRAGALEAENTKLKAALHDAEAKLGQLASASASEEVIKSFESEKSALKKENGELKAAVESALIERNAAITAFKDAKEKLAKKGKEFA